MSVMSAAEPTSSSARQQSISARLLPIRFGEFLCERDLISDEQLLDALGDHWVNGGKIGTAIARRGFLSTDEIERQAALYHGLDVIEID